MGDNNGDKGSQAGQLYENFVQALTFRGTLQAFHILCRQLDLDPLDHRMFYSTLKSKLNTWRAKALWSKLDKRSSHKEYKKGEACPNTQCLIIGAGPCGLRTAIELALLGCKVVVLEKRETFARNNVLHLWPSTIHDLRALGAKKFHGKFCAGAIDHISIRQLQLILVKVALLLGVEVHANLGFVQLLEPPEDQETQGIGWRAELHPKDHPISQFTFDIIIGADGRKKTLQGFRRKEFRGKLAIAITANFINRNTTAEAKVEEISGVAFIFNQKFFQDLKEDTGIDLENIVYYKDNTHYFVMTAKKQSLLDKGVIVNDYVDTEMLLSGENVNQEALLSYAREAADFATNYQLPALDFAVNHNDQPDVAMFDFTCMYASENASLVRERWGHRLLVALVGDSLLEPFWPMGTGCARGFLAAMDTAWMVKRWAEKVSTLEILAERESIYRLLPQTTTENISKNFEQYTIDPASRYPNLNSNCVASHQVRQLYITTDLKSCPLERVNSIRKSIKVSRRDSEIRPNRLLTWCQKQTESYQNVTISDLTSSWHSGLALCAIIHHFCPQLIDFDLLNEEDAAKNNQLAFDIAEQEFGISPVTTGKEMASAGGPDKLSMVMYLSKFYEHFRGNASSAVSVFKLRKEGSNDVSALQPRQSNSLCNVINLLPRKRTPKEKKSEEKDAASKRRRRTTTDWQDVLSARGEGKEASVCTNNNKVKSMASQLLAKFEENAAGTSLQRQGSMKKDFPQNLGGSDICYFCKKRVYVMERLSADGKFFHRECFKCEFCATTLRLGAYAFSVEEGKFYCKPHFTYCKLNNKARKRRNLLSTQTYNKGEAGSTTSSDGEAVTSSECAQAAGAAAEASPVSLVRSASVGTKRSKRAPGHVDLPATPPGQESGRALGGTGANMLAVRVMVASDDSGSDVEMEAAHTPTVLDTSGPGGSMAGPMGPGHRGSESQVEEEAEPGSPYTTSTPQEALRRAKSFQSPAMDRQEKWRKKLCNKLPLLLRKKMEQAGREGAVNSPTSPEIQEHPSQVRSHLTRGYSLPHRSPRQQRAEEGDAVCRPRLGTDSTAQLTTGRLRPAAASRSPRTVHKLSCWSGSEPAENRRSETLVPDATWSGDPGPSEAAAGLGDLSRPSPTSARGESRGDTPSPRAPSHPLGWSPPHTGHRSMETDLEDGGAMQTESDAAEMLLPDPGRQHPAMSSVLSPPAISIRSDQSGPLDSPTMEGAHTKSPGPESPGSPLTFLVNAFRKSFFESKSPVLPNAVEQPQEKKSKTRWARTFSSSSFHGLSLGASLAPSDGHWLRAVRPRSPFPPRDKGSPSEPPASPRPGLFPNSPKPSGSVDGTGASLGKGSHRSNRKEKDKDGQASPSALDDAGEGTSKGDIRRLMTSFKRKSVRHKELKKSIAKVFTPPTLQAAYGLSPPLGPEDQLVGSQFTEDESESSLDEPSEGKQKATRRRKVQDTALLQLKKEEVKRLHRAQIIQRQLQEVEEKQRVLEERGVLLEKVLRGESEFDSKDEPQLMQKWFKLVMEKNVLVCYEAQMMIFARELELEDHQSRLQQLLHSRMSVEDFRKTEKEIAEEKQMLSEMLEVIEQRDKLVALLEEQRQQEKEENRDLESWMLARGYKFNWS
ncbi:F-actin-monooxygenase MICAL2-like isoform X2 [Leucoraja erinacea]|uniref:F-actin-monooxygenase MICAL2-like isoform X2 n=1 Tax=Leucoraja erinaceus TaxID=7782 RepID=UPI002454567A|nr:F-actin-monooxygenase MICAL2-like isoform X2 [Leucoraja erinacea]